MFRSLRVWSVVFVAFLQLAFLVLDARIALGDESKKASHRAELCDERPWKSAAPQTFVISHGLGGCNADDRFANLATAISVQFPEANVVVVDWSETACQRHFGILSPWKVATNIDDVAAEATSCAIAESILIP